jgi:hypothetical protein
MKPTATLRLRFIWRLLIKTNGSIKRTISCTIAEAEFAYALAWISMHFPLMSRFQNADTGMQEKMVTKKMAKLLAIMYARKIYAMVRNLGVWKISR